MSRNRLWLLITGLPIGFAAWAIPQNRLLVLLMATTPAFLLVLLLSFRLFDRLLSIQFTRAHAEWEQQGALSGYFSTPPGSRKVSLRIRGFQWSCWFESPPAWIATDDAMNLYKWFRFLGWLVWLTFVPVFLWTVRLAVAFTFGMLGI
jgi:hypothetical protein